MTNVGDAAAAALRHPIAKGWLVHCVTASGAICGMLGIIAVSDKQPREAVLWLAVAMVLDVKSMCAEAMPVPDNIRACRGRFVYVQANDSNLQGPGFGAVDFVPILRTLREVGYDGWISVEVFDFTPGPEVLATQSLAYLRRCCPP